MTMDYSPWSERKIWPFLRVAISPKPKKPHPPKLVFVHVTSISTCTVMKKCKKAGTEKKVKKQDGMSTIIVNNSDKINRR